MKIKCKKIRNVEKSVCTAEQKIAYNYAFQWYSVGKKVFESNISESEKLHAMHDIEHSVLNSIKTNGIDKKYNIDAIIISFRQGFRKYCENFFIANNYEIIGKCFLIPYEII